MASGHDGGEHPSAALINFPVPALQRIAHLLCEQLARLEIDEGFIPLNQLDVADAAGLSAVHTNRIFQELRQLGMLSRHRFIEVVDKERLQALAAFDGRYLDLSESMSRWDMLIRGLGWADKYVSHGDSSWRVVQQVRSSGRPIGLPAVAIQ